MTLVSFAVFIIPAIIIATCYIVIVVVIWRSSMKFKTISNGCNEKSKCLSHNGTLGSVTIRFSRKGHGGVSISNKGNNSSATSSRGLIPRAKIKTIKMTFVIVLAFVLCWSPYFIWDLLAVYGHIPEAAHLVAVSTFIQSLAPLNSAANPLIYTLFNTAICTRIFRKRTHYNSPPDSQGATTASHL